MDKKQLIGMVMLAVALILGWQLFTSYWRRTHPEIDNPAPDQALVTPGPATTQSATQPATGPTTGPTTALVASTQATETQPAVVAAATSPTTEPATSPATSVAAGPATAPSIQPAGFTVVPATQPSDQVLGSAEPNDPTWAMQVAIKSQGASLKGVTLNEFKRPEDFKKPEKQRRPYVFQEPNPLVPGSDPLATQSVIINDDAAHPVALNDVPWTYESEQSSDTKAAYSVTIKWAGDPALRITKTYSLRPKSDASQGYDLSVEYGLENLSARAMKVRTAFNGPSMPPKEVSRGVDHQILTGYRDDSSSTITPDPKTIGDLKKDEPIKDITRYKEVQPVGWAGPASTYFAAFVLPLNSQHGTDIPAEWIGHVTMSGWKLDDDSVPSEDKPITMTFETTDVSLAAMGSAGSSKTLPMNVFLGPRWRKVLDTPYYSAYPRRFNDTLVVKSGMCGFCTVGPLITGMVWLLEQFHWLAGGFPPIRHGDWGIAIIMLVVCVRGALHPITKRSQVQMMKMSKMGPEMEKLKKKYADKPEELNKAMVQFYKQQGMGPILGCLPMFLQMPIWIALYSALQTTFELRQAPFLWGWTWIKDLAKPDYLINFGHSVPIPVLGWIWPNTWHFDGINILPVLLALVFWVNQKFQPKPAAVTDEQRTQQKMMQWMTLLFPVMLYNGPSGLNLYIMTSTLIGIVESKRIRDHIKEREAQEAAEKPSVIVDAKPTRASKQMAARQKDDDDPPKPGGLAGWWANLQQRAEQVMQERQQQQTPRNPPQRGDPRGPRDPRRGKKKR